MNAERLLAHHEQIADAPDAIARLRRFILDLAVRGKLVPQDPNDEPASELLKRIAKEKARLVKAGEIRKWKVLPQVEEPPFDLPRNWRWTPIREVASDRGQEIPQSTFTYIDVTAIDKEAGVVANAKVLQANEAPSRARKITRKDDVIYSCVRPYLLNVAVIETDFNPRPIASTAFAILNGHGLVMPRYLWIVLRSPFMVECVEENQRGQAYPAINDADFAVLPFPLPPLAEQHRIVAKVDELMGLYDRLAAARQAREAVRNRLVAVSLARLSAPDPETFQADARFALDALPALTTRPDQIKRLRQTILSLAIRGRLVPQNENDEPAAELLRRIAKEKARLVSEKKLKRQEELPPIDYDNIPFDVGAGWVWSKAGDIFLNVTDGFHNTPSPVTKGYPYITAKHIRPGKIDFDNCLRVDTKNHGELLAKTRVKRGDILIVNIGAGCGTAAIVDVDYEFSFKNVAILNLPSDMDEKFILLFLLYYRDLIFDELIKGGAQPFLGLGMLREMSIPIPPLAEQHRIAAKVDALMALCDRLEASLTVTAATRRRLLDALLTEALAPDEERGLAAAE
jgi:type I restriction enzyme, S subunit